MASYPFFSGFPPEALNGIASLAASRVFSDGDYLLRQGAENRGLYFLRSGALRVEVDGEAIAELADPGTVVGEMSLINRTPVAASVRAAGGASAFEVNEDHLLGLDPAERSRRRSLLDRFYASVLADRLAKTNAKAKGFESANRELTKTQERLRKINESLEAEIARRARELVRKVQGLTESRLKPAHARIARWTQNPQAAPAPAEVKETLDEISETIDLLAPVAALAERSGQGSNSRAMLVLDASKKQQNIMRLALGGTGVELSLASTPEEFAEMLAARAYEAIVVDAEFRAEAAQAAASQPNAQLVAMVGLDMDAYLEALRECPPAAFFVARDPDDRAFTIRNVVATANKILNQNVFGLERHLSWGAAIQERPVRDSREREPLIDELADHFKGLGVREAMLDRVRTATEELLMNAIYDAPHDARGKPLYNHLARTQPITLAVQRQGVLRYGTDGMWVGVSVSDPFGGLRRATLSRYLESLAGGATVSLNDAHGSGKGGAGRGLKLLIDSADLTVFNVAVGKKTEVISLFNLERAAAGDSKPTFHLYSVE